MKSLCLFASYFTSNDIPDYVKVYLKELKYHFNEVVLIGSQSPLSESSKEFLNEQSITYHFEKNEGFDFGLWYKGFQKINVQDYDQLALVNDSCVLFKPLDDFMNWAANEHSDMLGMTYSEAIAPHLQSYFLVLNKKAIAYLNEYFNTHKLVSDITNVIRTYEVGFSGFLLSKGLKLSAYMGNKGADSEFSPYYSLVKEQLAAGIPLIKKKILFTSYRKDEYLTLARMDFDIRSKTYLMLIRKYNPETIIPFEKLVAYSKNSPGIIAHVKHRVMRVLVRWYRKLKYGS
jgi:lipopolysaccharide biosynthesis protein